MKRKQDHPPSPNPIKRVAPLQVPDLPILSHKKVLLEGIKQHKVSIVSGDTGSGKSTQLVQYLYQDSLEHPGDIPFKAIVTQPRRLAAQSLASRVQQELDSQPHLHELDKHLSTRVGYVVGLDSRVGVHAKILYVTTGVFLQMLASNSLVNQVSHVFLDEVHERDLDSDFAMTALKHLLASYYSDKHSSWFKHFRLVLMSATINAQLFSHYFSALQLKHLYSFQVISQNTQPASDWNCSTPEHDLLSWREQQRRFCLNLPQAQDTPAFIAQITTPTRFPIKLFYLEDMAQFINRLYSQHGIQERVSWEVPSHFDLNRPYIKSSLFQVVADLILCYYRTVPSPKNILVFLPGAGEIAQQAECIHSRLSAQSGLREYLLIQLHRNTPAQEQNLVFRPHTPPKIIVATNLAESSLTIPDCEVVVDFCLAKENHYNPVTRLNSLQLVYCAKASAKQRMGRTGRLCNGFCFRILTKKYFDQLSDFSRPELLRTGLEKVVLKIKCLDLQEIKSLGMQKENVVEVESLPAQPDYSLHFQDHPRLFDDPSLVLGRSLEAPPLKSIRLATQSLQSLGALSTPDYQLKEGITYLVKDKLDYNTYRDSQVGWMGSVFNSLPCDTPICKVLLFGFLFNVLEKAAGLASLIQQDKSIFTSFSPHHPMHVSSFQKMLHSYDKGLNSDHLLQLRLYYVWRRTFAEPFYLEQLKQRKKLLVEKKETNHVSRYFNLDSDEETQQQEVELVKINSRFFRQRRRTKEEKSFLQENCLNISTLQDIFELQNEILIRLQKQGMQVQSKEDNQEDEKLMLVLLGTFARQTVPRGERKHETQMRQQMEAQGLDLEHSFALELPYKHGLERNQVEQLIYETLQEKEGMHIQKYVVQSDQLVFIELEACPEKDMHLRCLLHLEPEKKSTYSARASLVEGQPTQVVSAVYQPQHLPLQDKHSGKRVVADMASLFYYSRATRPVLCTGYQETTNSNQARLLSLPPLFLDNPLVEALLQLVFSPGVALHFSPCDDYVASLSSQGVSTPLTHFLTNHHIQQVVMLRDMINSRCESAECQSMPSDDLFLQLTQLLSEKDFVPIYQEDVWTKHFRETGQLSVSPARQQPKLEGIAVEEEEQVIPSKPVMLPTPQGIRQIRLDMTDRPTRDAYRRLWREITRLKLFLLEQEKRMVALGQKHEAFLLCPRCSEKICRLTDVVDQSFSPHLTIHRNYNWTYDREYHHDPRACDSFQSCPPSPSYVGCYNGHIYGYSLSQTSFRLADLDARLEYCDLEIEKLSSSFSKSTALAKDQAAQLNKKEQFRGETVCTICISTFPDYQHYLRHLKGSRHDQEHSSNRQALLDTLPLDP